MVALEEERKKREVRFASFNRGEIFDSNFFNRQNDFLITKLAPNLVIRILQIDLKIFDNSTNFLNFFDFKIALFAKNAILVILNLKN